jgi:hypothetical protein
MNNRINEQVINYNFKLIVVTFVTILLLSLFINNLHAESTGNLFNNSQTNLRLIDKKPSGGCANGMCGIGGGSNFGSNNIGSTGGGFPTCSGPGCGGGGAGSLGGGGNGTCSGGSCGSSGGQGSCSGGSCGGGQSGGCSGGGCGGGKGGPLGQQGKPHGKRFGGGIRGWIANLRSKGYIRNRAGNILGSGLGSVAGVGGLGNSGNGLGGGCSSGSCGSGSGGSGFGNVVGGCPGGVCSQPGSNNGNLFPDTPQMDCSSGTCQLRSQTSDLKIDTEKKNLVNDKISHLMPFVDGAIPFEQLKSGNFIKKANFDTDSSPSIKPAINKSNNFEIIKTQSGPAGSDQVREWMEKQEGDSKRVIKEIHKFKERPSDVDPERLDRFNRGVSSKKEAELNHIADMTEMLLYYGPQAGLNSCSAHNIIGTCKKRPDAPIIYPERVPYWEYYIPFQKVEVTQIPFQTAYLEHKEVMTQLERSDKTLYQDAAQKLPQNWKDMDTGVHNYNSPNEADQKALNKLSSKNPLFERWRGGEDNSTGSRFAEYHFMSTWFHEAFKYDKSVAGSIFTAKKRPVWCHDGSVMAVKKRKREIPNFFSEFTGQGLMYRTYAYFSYLNRKLSKYLPPKGTPLNCFTRTLESRGGQTPAGADGIKMPETLRGAKRGGILEHCFVTSGVTNHRDTVGPFTNRHKTKYASLAAEQAFLRGLILAKVVSSASDAIHPVRRRFENGFKRDRKMILTNQTVGHNDKLPKGCGDWNNKPEIMSDWGGVDYGEGNHSKSTSHFNRQVLVHWRYIRCCPVGYEVETGQLPQQTF